MINERRASISAIITATISILAVSLAIFSWLYPFGFSEISNTPTPPIITVSPIVITLEPTSESIGGGIPTPTPNPMATISILETRIASLENVLQNDPQTAVSLLLVQRDIDELSEKVEDTQRDIDRLYTIVMGSLITLLLILVGAILPFSIARLISTKEQFSSKPDHVENDANSKNRPN